MRKYISTILTSFFVFAFILWGFNFSISTASAYDSGCISGATYSITTGQPCYGSQVGYQTNSYIPGCFGTNAYSTTTGQYCFGSQVGGYQNNTYIPGCIAGNAFSVTTGQSCYGSQIGYQNNTYIAGCTGGSPYSTITGQLCYGSYGNQSNNFINQQFYIGQRGPDVLALQQMLASTGLYFGTIDGIYGPMTDQAFVAYQARYSGGIYNPIPTCPYPYYNNSTACPISSNGQPVISGVSGPQSLSVNQTGTWTVNAYSNSVYNTYNSNLSYSVNWGDQNAYPYYSGLNAAQGYYPQQSATFTHSYLQAGTYTAIFTVTNSTGQTAQTSLTVNVGGSGYYGGYTTPTISYLSPNSGTIGSQVTIYGTGFSSNSTNTVSFGGNLIQNIYSYNGTSMTFTVPSSINPSCLYTYPACSMPSSVVLPGMYAVYVTNTTTNAISNSVNFTVTGSSQGFSPTISYITPTSGSVGTQVTIYGSGFTSSNNTVNIGSASVYNLSSYNSSTLTFTVPSWVGTVFCVQAPCAQNFNVSVTNANGTSNPVNFLINNGGLSSSPTIYSLTPTTGSIGTTVTINGTGFTSTNNIVHFVINNSSNSLPGAYLPNISSNGNTITFTVPQYSSMACQYSHPMCDMLAFQLTAGTYNVWVENSQGTSNQTQFFLH